MGGTKPTSWWVMLGGTIGVILLDFAPWVSLPFGLTLSGADASWGVIPAITGTAALVAVLCDAGQRRDSAVIVALVFGAISAGVSLLWAIDVFGNASQTEILGESALSFVHPAWGLYFEIAAGAAVVVGCSITLAARRRAD